MTIKAPGNSGKVDALQHLIKIEEELEGIDVSGEDGGQVYLQSANLSGGYLANANFSYTNLRGSNFTKSYVLGAKFNHSILNGSKFDGADMPGANFANATLIGATFTDTDLRGASFKNAQMFVDDYIEIINAAIKNNPLFSEYKPLTDNFKDLGSFKARLRTDFRKAKYLTCDQLTTTPFIK